MKYLLCLFLVVIAFLSAGAQFLVKFKLGKYPLQHAGEKIFISGNFNKWDPKDKDYTLSSASDTTSVVTIKLKPGYYEYKVTRGNWETVETLDFGVDIDNHEFDVNGDTTIIINIQAWKDDFKEMAGKHSASAQVHLMDSAFFMPQLNRTRRIWIYLPEGYEHSKKRYPVLYMQDGQNLFDRLTAINGEWGVDECLDSMIRTGKQGCIVVGIDNGPRRFNEYNPYEFQNYGKGEADQYLAFLTETLKPFVDHKYRTLPGKENTIIAGSSMGGLLAYYAMLKKPGVFGKAGVFSPAFWTALPVNALTDSLAKKIDGKFFFYVGEKEGESFVKDVQEIQNILGEKSTAMIYSVVDPQGRHNEKAWRKWFYEFYAWMMADGFNTVIKINN
jgi:metallo-beta-lactamase class B